MPNNERTQLQTYRQMVFEPDDIVELRLIRKRDGKIEKWWFKAKELPEQVEMLEQYNQSGFDIYAGPNPRRAKGLSSDENVRLARCIFADFDHIENGDIEPSEFILKNITEAGLPKPTMLIDSGHGIHAYWLLEEPLIDLERWKLIQQRLIATLDSDKAIKNPERIMRLPGFLNVKKKPYLQCSIIFCDSDRRYKFDDIVKHLAELPKNMPEPIQGQNDTVRQDNVKPLEKKARAMLYAAKWSSCGQGERNEATYHHACQLRDFDLSETEAFEILADWNSRNCPALPEAEIRKAITNANNYAKKPAGTKLNEPLKSKIQTQSEWELPAPLGHFNLPKFPLEAFPEQLCVLCEFCAAVAESYQVPADLPAMLVLSVAGASLAKRIVVHVRGDHWEPVNLFTVVALPPGNRKSGVFSVVTEPFAHFERLEAERLAPMIEQNRNQRIILEESLKYARKQAAKAKKTEDRESYKEQASEFLEELSRLKSLITPQYIGDDATPESVALLLDDNAGRFALLSPEGDVFDLMAGRYNSGTPNLGVYLKGHAGDDIRVNRANRDSTPRYVHKPALSIGVAVQPEVLRGLTLKKGFRGRGLLGRFLYSVPESLLGHRKINPCPVDSKIAAAYQNKILDALRLEPNIDENGDPCPHIVTVGSDALKEIDRFAIEVEKQLAPGGEFASMGDWAGKLVGAVCRIAGIFHGLIYAASGNPAKAQIDAETMLGAIAIGEYLIPHAKAAFFEMGADPEIDSARRILDWISSEQMPEFTKREAFNSLRGGIQKVADLDKPLEILVNHGYIREILQEHKGPGRKPSQKYKINPLWLAHNTQNTQNNHSNLNSAYSAQFAQEVTI